MRKALAAALVALAAAGSLAAQEKSPSCKSCGEESFGTSIQWMGSTGDAATKAKEEKKLVFVLHVSGYFEDPKFT